MSRAPGVVFLAFLSVLSFPTVAAALPAPAHEVAVSEPSFMPAASHQLYPRAASNGDVTLVVWRDERTGSTTSYAARLRPDGSVLDELSIPLPGYALDVLWTGETFAVVLSDGGGSWQLAYVDIDGTVREARPMHVPSGFQYQNARSGGGNGRFLFMHGAVAAVLDGAGYFRGAASVGDLLYEEEHAAGWLATAATPEGFLGLLRARNDPARSETLYAVRIDENGTLLSFADTKLTPHDEYALLERGSDGFVLLARPMFAAPVIAFQLDVDGVFTGKSFPFGESSGKGAKVPAAIEWDGRDYVVASHVDAGAGQKLMSLSALSHDLVIQRSEVARDLVGHFGGIALVRDFEEPLLVSAANLLFTSSGYDLSSQRISATLETSEAKVIAFSATTQTTPDIVTTQSGYAVTWNETGPDRFVRGLVRRFTKDGTPIDPEPLELFREEADFIFPHAFRPLIIAASGGTYASIWDDPDRNEWVVRRLGAPGAWLDPSAVTLGLRWEITWAANPSGLTLFGTTECHGPAGAVCLATQRITFGEQLTAETLAAAAESTEPYNLSIACTGAQCLLLWAEGYGNRYCPILCPYIPSVLFALRVDAEGAPLDEAPIEIDGAIRDVPTSLIWSGERYVLAWADAWDPSVQMAFMSKEGHFEENGGSTVMSIHPQEEIQDLQLIAFGDDAGLVTQTVRHRAGTSEVVTRQQRLQAICTRCSTEPQAAGPVFTLLDIPAASRDIAWLAVASWGREFVTAYARPGEPEKTGSVSRVFSRIFAPAAKRRSARH